MSTNPAPRGLVYVLTTPDGKEYVGQTAGPMWQRLVRHRRDTRRNPERPICAAFLQHGQGAIKVTILASGIGGRAERVAIEARVIAERNTMHPHGLNILPAADITNHLHTVESRVKAADGVRRFLRENPDVAKARMDHARPTKLHPNMIDGMLRDLAAGASYQSLARKHGVRKGQTVKLFLRRMTGTILPHFPADLPVKLINA